MQANDANNSNPALPDASVVVPPTTSNLAKAPATETSPNQFASPPTAASAASSSSPGGTQNRKRNLPIELQNEQKRRSSSRSIKRKRFDDEIVEYSIGFPQSRGDQHHRVGRPRAAAQPHTAPSLPPPSPVTPIAPPLSVTPVISPANVETKSPINPTATTDTSSTSPKLDTAITLNPPTKPSTNNNASISIAHHPTFLSKTSTATPSPMLPTVEKRRAAPRAHGRRSRRAGRPPTQVATKNLGRWKPIDDLALIIGVQQTNDLRMVHRGVKFSCKFSLQEIQARWVSLLYEPAISRTAMAAIRNLHPELVDSVKRRALFSTDEEEILGTIKSTDNPKLEKFQELLDNHSSAFYSSRTPKILQKHWQLMKRYQLLPDQSTRPPNDNDQPMVFSDAEDHILDTELNEQRDETLETELALTDRKQKREIRLIENELSRWNVLVDSITNSGIAPEFDGQTLAVLRGRSVRYLMRSKEITFGRPAKDSVVDVDLSLEGPAAKISRRQGTIKLRSNGDFFIANEGKRSIFIDGLPLMTCSKTRLTNNCVVEICGLRFVFLVNYELINAIRHESAKTTAPLN